MNKTFWRLHKKLFLVAVFVVAVIDSSAGASEPVNQFKAIILKQCLFMFSIENRLTDIEPVFLTSFLKNRADRLFHRADANERIPIYLRALNAAIQDPSSLAKNPEVLDILLEELNTVTSAFTGKTLKSGTKSYTYSLIFSPTFTKPLQKEIEPLFRQHLARAYPRPPLYIRIIGLGSEVGEVAPTVSVVDRILENLLNESETPINDVEKQKLVEKLNLKIHLYDIDTTILRYAVAERTAIERVKPWAKNIIFVDYADLMRPQFFDVWSKQETALIMVRNSLRDRLVIDASQFLFAALDSLRTGGIFVTDWEADRIMYDMIHYLNLHIERAGTFGLSHSEEESFMSRKM